MFVATMSSEPTVIVTVTELSAACEAVEAALGSLDPKTLVRPTYQAPTNYQPHTTNNTSTSPSEHNPDGAAPPPGDPPPLVSQPGTLFTADP